MARDTQIFDARPSLPVFPELRRTGRFRLNGQARSDTGSPVPAHSRPAYERDGRAASCGGEQG
jgi:hypothetical protein